MKYFIKLFTIGVLANIAARLILNRWFDGSFSISGSDLTEGIIVSIFVAVVLSLKMNKPND
jgi:hypothetical protein